MTVTVMTFASFETPQIITHLELAAKENISAFSVCTRFKRLSAAMRTRILVVFYEGKRNEIQNS